MSEPLRWSAEGVGFEGGEIAELLQQAADWLVGHPGYFVKGVLLSRDEFGDRVELYGWER